MVVFRDNRGQTSQRLLTYIPDKDYVQQNAGRLSANSLRNLDRNFFGYIEYKNWSGEIVSVLRIENGKVKRIYKIGNTDKTTGGKDKSKTNKSAIMGSSQGKITQNGYELFCFPIYDTVCEVIENGNPAEDMLNEVECTYQEVGEDCIVVPYVDEPPPEDEEPCPWGNCNGEEPPCWDCEPEPCWSCEEIDPAFPKEINNNIADSCLRSTIGTALFLNNNIKGTISNIINKFAQKNSGIIINLTDNLTTGTAVTQITSSSSNNFILNINFNASFFANISKEAVISELIHEVVHSYLLFTNNNYKSLPLSEQHNYLFQNYIKDMAIYLMDKYGMSRIEAFGMAWHGTDLFNNANFDVEFLAKLDDDNAEIKISKSDLHFGFLPYYQDNSDLEQKGTPNCK